MLADVGALVLPIVPAMSGIVRAGKMADKAMDAGRALERGEDFSDFFRWMDRQADVADEMITVRHYTDYDGMMIVLKKGKLRAGAWVTIPSEIPHGMGKAGIRRAMAIDDKLALPRTGDFFIDAQVGAEARGHILKITTRRMHGLPGQTVENMDIGDILFRGRFLDARFDGRRKTIGTRG